MASDYYLMPAALACASAAVHSRKVSIAAAIKHGDVGVCFRYKCERDSSAQITAERDPKKCEFNKKAHLNLGDQIRGKTVVAYVAGRRPIRISKGSNYSATHSIGHFETEANTYAELTEAFENIVNSVAKQQASLPALTSLISKSKSKKNSKPH